MRETIEPEDVAIIGAELWEARRRSDAKLIIESGDIVEGEPTGWLDSLLEDAHRTIAALSRDLEAASEFRFGDVLVTLRGDDLWAVKRGGSVMNKDDCWEYEPFPSNRSDEFIARTRFSLADALERGRRLSSDNRDPEKKT